MMNTKKRKNIKKSESLQSWEQWAIKKICCFLSMNKTLLSVFILFAYSVFGGFYSSVSS